MRAFVAPVVIEMFSAPAVLDGMMVDALVCIRAARFIGEKALTMPNPSSPQINK